MRIEVKRKGKTFQLVKFHPCSQEVDPVFPR